MKKTLLKYSHQQTEIRLLQKYSNKYLRKIFPKGSKISWIKGSKIQNGIVKQVNDYWWNPCILVVNIKTQNTIRITPYDVLQAGKAIAALQKAQSEKRKV